MNEFNFTWIISIIVIVSSLVGLAFLGLKLSRIQGRRIGRIMGAADKLGLDFSPKLQLSSKSSFSHQFATADYMRRQFSGFAPFDSDIQFVNNVVSGLINDVEFMAFEATIVRIIEGEQTFSTVAVATIAFPYHFPGVCLGDVPGWNQPKIETELPAFNNRYPVRTSDQKFAFGLLHPQMMEFLLASKVPDFQIGAHRAVIYGCEQMDAELIMASHKFFKDFWNLVPDYLKEDFKL
jgi:hypothetical protein